VLRASRPAPDPAETAVLPGPVGIPVPRDPWGASAGTEHTHDPHEVTVQLEAVVRQPGVRPGPGGDSGLGEGEGADRPVFVDESGRRSRRFRRIGMALALACAVYAVVIVATLASGSSNAPWLPVPGQQDDGPAQKVDTSPLPSLSTQPSGPAGASPDPSASLSGGTTPSPGASALTPGASTTPHQPGTSADSTPAASQTAKKPTPGGPGTSKTPPPPATTPPETSQPPEPTGDQTTPPDGGTGPGPASVADGPQAPLPVTGELSSTSSPFPEYTL